MGIPVVIASNGRGICVRNVTSGAPVMTVATNGFGIPIVMGTTGIPFVVQGAGVVTPAPVFTVQPSISGTPQVGQTLTGSDGTITNGTVSARRWLLDGTAISGATGGTYVPVAGDVGYSITYRVFATGAGGSTVATSPAVGPVIGSGGTPTPSPTVTAPVLTVVTDNATYPPQIDASLSEDTLVGDTARLQYSHDATFTTGVTTVDRVLANTSPVSYSLTGITTGTNRFRASILRSAVQVSDWSATVTHGPDDLAPVLSLPIASSTGTTTATVGATTDTGEGTIYFVVVLTNSAPTAAQIKLGKNSAGAAAASTASVTPVASGAKTANVTGLSQNTTYYTFAMHEDVAGNQSNVVGASSFTTDTAPVFGMSETAAPAMVTSPGGTNYTFTAAAIGAADSTRDIYVMVGFDNSGSGLTGLTIGGVSATLLKQIGASGPMNLYKLAVPTGTTADIVVGSAAAFNCLSIKVWRVVGGGTPTIVFAGVGYNSSPYTLDIVTPSGGGTLLFARQGTATGTPAWTNATGSSTAQGGGKTHMSAYTTTPGSVTVSYTGFAGFSEDCWIAAEIPAA